MSNKKIKSNTLITLRARFQAESSTGLSVAEHATAAAVLRLRPLDFRGDGVSTPVGKTAAEHATAHDVLTMTPSTFNPPPAPAGPSGGGDGRNS